MSRSCGRRSERACPKALPAPAGAQGDLSALQWIIEIATDPVMAKAYATGLIYGVNQIISAATSKQATDKSSNDVGGAA